MNYSPLMSLNNNRLDKVSERSLQMRGIVDEIGVHDD